MQRKSIWAPIVATGVAIAALFYLYFFASINVVVIENVSGVDLDEVEIVAGSVAVWKGRLEAGEKKLRIIQIKEEGSFLIRVCETAISECSESHWGYFTSTIFETHSILADK